MNHKNQTNSYTEFYYHLFRNILVVSLPLLILSALILSLPHSSANGVDTLTLTLSSSCTMSSVVDTEHNGSLTSGTYIQNIGQTTIKTLCNDGNGYSVYANGYSNNEEGNNKLINSEYPEFSIDTGLATSGLTSTWAMKLNNIENDPSPTPPVIETAYNDAYGLVPNIWVKVACRASGTTDMDEGSSFTTTYAVYASSNQHAGTYVGQVKYVLTHPAYPPAFHYMQDVANWQNEMPNPGDTLLATDARDNKEYWVTRLADGHIWMTQNLDFDIRANTTLNSNTTDLNVIYSSSTGNYQEYLNGYTTNNGVIYWKPASTTTTIGFQSTGPVTGWGDSNTEPYSANKTDSTETGHTSLGNWYNWTAAIASNNSSSLTQNTSNDITKNPQNSICPKGWRLPTISNQPASDTDSTNEFARLNQLYNNGSTSSSSNLITSPLWFVQSGYIYDSSLNDRNSGRYWSSTISNDRSAYALYFINTTISPTDSNGYKDRGRSVRCLAR